MSRAVPCATAISAALISAAAIGVVIALGVALTREAVGDLHHLLFEVPIEAHLSGAQTIADVAAAAGPLARRARLWSDRRRVVAVAAARHRRSDRGQRAAWRAHVARRQPSADAADGVVGRGRRLGRPRGRIYAARFRHCLGDRHGCSSCAATICGFLSDAAPPRRSPPRSTPRSPAPFMPSS